MLPPLLLKRIGACWILKLWHDVTTHAYSLFLVSTIVECVFIINAIILKLETCYMLNIGNYEMHILPSQKHTVHCIELGILRAVAYLSSLHIYPYLSSLHPQESSKMPKKNIKHMKISQHQGQISIQTLSHSLPKWSITYKCDQLIFCVDHTLLWQHITALNQIARVHSPNTMSLMLLWKDWGLSLKKWVSWENATIMQLSRKSSGGSGNAAAAGKKNTKKGKKGSTHCLQ